MNPREMTQGQRLAADAAAAAEVRGYQTDPDVVALRVEQVRAQVERLIWAGMVLGLCFTMVNVQHFAATGAVMWSLAWCAAWLLDPMVSLVLLGVLRAEQITARWQVRMGPWPRGAKWVLLAAMYVMNTWSSWVAGSVSGVMLHSVPVLLVFVAAEAVTDCQNKLTECVHRAHAWASDRTHQRAQTEPDTHPGHTVAVAPAAHPAVVGGGSGRAMTPPPPARQGRSGASSRTVRPAARGRRVGTSGGRVLFADYLASARTALTPGTEITPAWVRQVTGCSRGLSSRLAAELRAQHPSVPASTPLTAEQLTVGDDWSDRPEGKAA